MSENEHTARELVEYTQWDANSQLSYEYLLDKTREIRQ
jgi:hypothetical protein